MLPTIRSCQELSIRSHGFGKPISKKTKGVLLSEDEKRQLQDLASKRKALRHVIQETLRNAA